MDACDWRETARQDVVDGFAARYIVLKARQVIGRAGCNSTDVEDVEQELRRHLLARVDRYDASRAAWSTFAVLVIDSRVADLINSGRAARRFPPARPIDGSPATDGHGLLDRLSDQDDRRRPHPCTDLERLQLRLDIEVRFERLDPRDQDLCRNLKDGSVSDAARRLGIPRSTLDDRRRRLQDRFHDLNPGNSD